MNKYGLKSVAVEDLPPTTMELQRIEAVLVVLEEAGVDVDLVEAIRNQLPGAGADEAAMLNWLGETR